METEQQAERRTRRPTLARAGSVIAPALVLAAAIGLAGQVHLATRVVQGTSYYGGASLSSEGSPLSLRVGLLLADPSTSWPSLVPAVALLALAVLHVLRAGATPVPETVRRAGAALAALVTLVGLVFVVVVVGWVVMTHGRIGSDGSTGQVVSDTFDASLQLDPWDTLLGSGGTALLEVVLGCAATVMLLTAATVPGVAVPGGAAPGSRVPATGAGADAHPGPRTLTGAAPAPDEVVVLASVPAVDPSLFRRPGREAPASGGGGRDGYRRPPGSARTSG